MVPFTVPKEQLLAGFFANSTWIGPFTVWTRPEPEQSRFNPAIDRLLPCLESDLGSFICVLLGALRHVVDNSFGVDREGTA